MTFLPWQHTRSRTKSGNEKTGSSHPNDWFSKSSAEPSRQAFADLVKAHNRMKSDESHSSRSSSRPNSRPRTSTAASSHSQGKASRSRLSGDRTRSRSSSQCTHEDHLHFSIERPESSNKALLPKGNGLLRRTSSIMSLSSSSAASSSTLGLTSPPRSSRASSAASRHDDLRGRISQPFDFQHITHTEDTQFTGLGRIDESTLADQFVAATQSQVQADATGLRGIAVSELHTPPAVEEQPLTSPERSVCSTEALSADLPQSPPRPLPPPKDEKTAADISSVQGFESAGMMWLATNSEQPPVESASRNSTCPSHLESKPLPQLPVVHAITTEDDTAREMIASPLPSPPLPTVPYANIMTLPPLYLHQQRPSLNARGANSYPTTKSSMPNLLAVHHPLTAPKQLSRHHSDMSLFQQVQAAPPTESTRTSVSFAAVDIMNWEDAVDEAWDDVDDGSSGSLLKVTQPEIPPVESTSSTPLMMTTVTCGGLTKSPNRMSSSQNLEVRPLESVKEDEPIIDLTGLGISSCPASGVTASVPRLSRASSINFSKRRSSSGHVNEALTRSSSQESFILSIASSMGCTQRSSNSSVSAADLTSMYYGSHGDDCNHIEHDEVDHDHVGSARPESGCLPPDILEQISQFGASFSAAQVCHAENIPPVPALPKESREQSLAQLSVPERRSSIVATNGATSTRKRSSTWGSKPRQISSPSYSLFPSVHPVSSYYTTVTSS